MATKRSFSEVITIIAFIVSYILAIIVIIQILRILFGGSWAVEEVILALVVLNITLTFGIGGYLFHLSGKIATVDRKLHGHIEWHRGLDKVRDR